MNQPTLKDLAELAGMTEKELHNKVFGFRCRLVSKEDAAKDLALALIKARRDELHGMMDLMKHCSPKHAEAACDNRISTLTEALKAGGRE